jgi:hypothetical protein
LQDAINTRKQKEQELFGEFAYKGEEILKWQMNTILYLTE